VIKRIKKYRKALMVALLVLGVGYYFCLPKTLFDDPYATVVNDRSGALLSARIASDGQWRFPELDSLPQKYVTALLSFEDKRFYYPLELIRWHLDEPLSRMCRPEE
jgi:penicillin-binding protein 1C